MMQGEVAASPVAPGLPRAGTELGNEWTTVVDIMRTLCERLLCARPWTVLDMS